MKHKLQLIVGWILTPFFLLSFALATIIALPFLIIARIFGIYPHYQVQICMTSVIICCLSLLCGIRFKITRHAKIPTDRPLIVIANHQSLFDNPHFFWLFRKNLLRFVAKKELANYLYMGVSHVLRNGGSALIDRSDRSDSVKKLKQLGAEADEKKFAICIFPEGTRARDGVMKKFKPAGVTTLISNCPSALIVPVAVCGSWKLLRYGFKPMPFGTTVSFDILPPIEPAGKDPRDLLQVIEDKIRVVVDQAEHNR